MIFTTSCFVTYVYSIINCIKKYVEVLWFSITVYIWLPINFASIEKCVVFKVINTFDNGKVVKLNVYFACYITMFWQDVWFL